MRLHERPARGLALFAALFALSANEARAYRTGADQASTSDTARVRWGTSTVDLFVDEAGCPGVPFSSIETALQSAMATWNGAECGPVPFRYRGTTAQSVNGDGVNTVQWHTTGWTSLGFPSGAAGTTDLVYRKNAAGAWEIVEADVHLNATSLTWSATSGAADTNTRSAEAVLTHELGHVIGLLHPCEPGGVDGAPDCATSTAFAAATMYPLYTGPSQAVLADDDAAGACFLYPTVDCSPACGAGTTCVRGACVATCGGEVCSALESCIGGACVDPCTVSSCGVVIDCNVDADCPSGDACWLRQCTRRVGQLGDPCATNTDCAAGVCDAGACTRYCVDACPDGFACDGRVCQPTLGAFGAQCASADVCLSGICVVGTASTHMCTRRCDGANLPCPSGTTCEAIGTEMACVPARASSGCSVAPAFARRAGSARSVLFSWLFLVLALAVRKRVRSA